MKEEDLYALGYGDTITTIFSTRTAKNQCAYLLPYIKPGMNILDAGCGPGSITADFAELVSDQGSVMGVDIDEYQLTSAYELSQKRKLKNIDFKNANIMELPFEDDTFDVCHTSGVLCQIKDPFQALNELRRVTKMGGLIAAREPIFECYIIYPDDIIFKESIRQATVAVNSLDSDFNLGKKLGYLFFQAGLKDIMLSASCESQVSQAAVKAVCDSLLEDWATAPWSQYIREHRMVDEATIKHYLKAIKAFPDLPGAFLSIPWGQVIGRV